MPVRNIRRERVEYLTAVRTYAKTQMGHLGKAKILDAGCGNGAFLRAIKSIHKSINAVGIDKDSKAIKQAVRIESKRPMGLKYAVCQIEKLMFKTSTFDIVIIALVLHEVEPKARKAMLKEAKRVLKRNGKIIVIDGPLEKNSIIKAMRSLHMKNINVSKFNDYDNAYTAEKG
ncbi:MAG: class I SAM-dependent methyltransferase [Candidatus Micrarchaeaceae archaeon]